MLEIPESTTLARQLDETLTGRSIEDVVAAQNPHGFAWYSGEPSVYRKLLVGRGVAGANAVAGYIRVDAGGATLLFHDGVNVRLLEPGETPPVKHQLLLRFDDGSGVVCTVQMYGGIMAFEGDSFENKYYDAAKRKPSPLCADFDQLYFDAIVSAAPAKLSAKGLLATEQRIPGLGNGCLQDILFQARVNPQSKVSALSEDDRANIFISLKGTLRDMTEGGGRDTGKDLFGKSGGYRTVLSSKTLSNPCPVCGGPITRKTYMGGNVYFCPTCQPIKK